MISSNTLMLIESATIILGVCGAVGFCFNFLKKKGVKVDTILKNVETVVEDAGVAIKAGKSFSNDSIFTELDLIDNLALKAVKTSQQLYISSQLPLEQRKENAKGLIIDGLRSANIKDTAELDTLINMAIESSVFDSKTDAEKLGQQQNALQQQITQLQNQVTSLNTEKNSLTQENQSLNEKLANIIAQTK